MNMVLCHGCKRHIFAEESSCPFCGAAPTAPTARVAKGGAELRALAPELSRAERYAIGAAMAVSVATAGCGSPTTVHNADEIRTVDVNTPPDGSGSSGDTGAGNGSNNVLEIARDPQGNETETQVADPEAEQRRREALEQKKRAEALQRQQELQEQQQQHWRNRPPCHGNVCPPYGCVFPDEACDVVRA